ncbi:MAG: hypothetical protein L3J81_04360, partial [Thermoplasmata archaeon]|nr:hypothetical protein [Thermoplasmata archaeon]
MTSRPKGRWILGFLLLLLIASLFAVTAPGGGAGAPPYPHRVALSVATAPAVTTHGDLIVGPSNSPYLIAPGSSMTQTYEQAGNVTVLPGGQLTILNTEFVFDQY